MRVELTPTDLVAFEDEVAQRFADREISAPIHLSGGNEEQLIGIFREHVNPEDWVLSTWRSHYHCLLKGVPREQVMAAILAGQSISLCFPSHRFLSSAIVGGTAPIAVGVAAGIKRKGEQGRRKAVCFIGDSTAATGIYYESVKYATYHGLPLLFVVENNGLSVATNTDEAWGCSSPVWEHNRHVQEGYAYTMTRPHCGIGRHVSF